MVDEEKETPPELKKSQTGASGGSNQINEKAVEVGYTTGAFRLNEEADRNISLRKKSGAGPDLI